MQPLGPPKNVSLAKRLVAGRGILIWHDSHRRIYTWILDGTIHCSIRLVIRAGGPRHPSLWSPLGCIFSPDLFVVIRGNDRDHQQGTLFQRNDGYRRAIYCAHWILQRKGCVLQRSMYRYMSVDAVKKRDRLTLGNGHCSAGTRVTFLE